MRPVDWCDKPLQLAAWPLDPALDGPHWSTMIKLTETRDITPYPWAHPDEQCGKISLPVQLHQTAEGHREVARKSGYGWPG
jgi:hypothetical protein